MSHLSYQRFCCICGAQFTTGRCDAKYCPEKSTCRWRAYHERSKSADDMKAKGYQKKEQAAPLVTRRPSTATEVLVDCLCGCGQQFLCPANQTATRMYINHTHSQRAYRARRAAGLWARRAYQVSPALEVAAR